MYKYGNSRKNIKLIFYPVIQLVFLILLMYFSMIVSNSPGLNSKINSSLSIVSQEQRAIFLVSLSTVLFITIFIKSSLVKFNEPIRKHKEKYKTGFLFSTTISISNVVNNNAYARAAMQILR